MEGGGNYYWYQDSGPSRYLCSMYSTHLCGGPSDGDVSNGWLPGNGANAEGIHGGCLPDGDECCLFGGSLFPLTSRPPDLQGPQGPPGT